MATDKMITARLDSQAEEALSKTAELLGLTKSDVVRESVKEYCGKIVKQRQKTPWQVYQAIHKPGGSGHQKRLSKQREIIRKHLEKRRSQWSS
jgi:hypothetical protein